MKIDHDSLGNGLTISLTHPNPFVRKTAAWAIGYYTREGRAYETLLRMSAHDEDEEVRRTAGEARLRLYNKLRLMEERIPLAETAEEIGRERALEETRAYIAHEIKNAVSPLRMFAKSLKEDLAEGEIYQDRLAENVERILGQTDAVYETVDRFLEYAQPLTPAFRAADMQQLLNERLQEIRAECERREIKITLDCAHTSQARVDPTLIGQALRNILRNALESMERGGTLHIATSQKEQRVIVKISDTGTGIKNGDLEHVFDLGFSVKAGKSGAGLGLAFVRRIVTEGHGGRVSIANNENRVGAVVTLELPLYREEEDLDEK